MSLVRGLFARLSAASLVASAFVLYPVTTFPASANPGDDNCELIGSGAQNDPYLVATEQDLAEIGDCADTGVFFEQFQDIQLSTSYTSAISDFEGHYEGNSFRISGLTVNTSDAVAGLFGEVAPGSSFSNMVIADSVISSTNLSANVGVLFGKAVVISPDDISVDLFNIAIYGAELQSYANSGGIGGELIDPGMLQHLVVKDSYVSGRASIGGFFGDMLVTQSRGYDMNRWLVQDSSIERTNTPTATTNFLGGLVGELTVVNQANVIINLQEVGVNATLIANNADGDAADDSHAAGTGGLIGRVDASSPSTATVNIVASGVIAEVENETSNTNYDSFAGFVYDASGIELNIDLSYVTATAKDALPAGGDIDLYAYFGEAGSPTTFDVNRTFIDSDKSTSIQGSPVTKTTAELQDPDTFTSAGGFLIQDNLVQVLNNVFDNGGYFNAITNGGFLSFVWAREYYGPYAHFNTSIANGYLLPDVSLLGLNPANTYFLEVSLRKGSNNDLVPLQLSSDSHSRLPNVLTSGLVSGSKYTGFVFEGTPAQIAAATWRMYVDPLDIVGESILQYEVQVRDALLLVNSTLNMTNSNSLTILACDLESRVNIGFPATGTADDPFQVSSVADLAKVGQCMGPGKHFELTTDLDFGGVRHTPIGHDLFKFSGVFDGLDHSINGLYLNEPYREDQGLFGEFGDDLDVPGATIKNLTVQGDVTGWVRAAIVVGDTDQGNFVNVSASGTVFAGLSAGLLTGDAEYLDARDITLDGDVTVRDEEAGLLAGDVANAYVFIDGVTASGRVVGEDYALGGLIGRLDSDVEGSIIQNVEISTDVQVRLLTQFVDNNDIGGLVGESYDMEYRDITIRPLLRPGEITGAVKVESRPGFNLDSNNFGGAIGGSHSDVLTNVVSYLDVTIENADDGDDETGGLIGEIEGSEVYDSSAYGDVSGAYEVGGLIGEMDGVDGTKIVDNSHAYGDVTGYERVGGLVGHAETDSDFPDEYLEITNSSASGEVFGVNDGVHDLINVGGLVGRIYSASTRGLVFTGNQYLGGNVEAPEHDQVGGLVGRVYMYGGPLYFNNNSAEAEVEGYEDVGGLAGAIDANEGDLGTSVEAHDLSFTGNVIGTADYVGGLFGWINSDGPSSILDTTVTADVSTVGQSVGGIAGQADFADEIDIIGNHIVSRIIESDESSFVGGLFGQLAVYGDLEISDFSIGSEDSSNLRTRLLGDDYVGGLVGEAYVTEVAWSEISEIDVSVDVEGTDALGGLFGYLEVSASELYIDAVTIDGEFSGFDEVGGALGSAYVWGPSIFTFDESSVTFEIESSDNSGGFFGLVKVEDSLTYFGDLTTSGTLVADGEDAGGFGGELETIDGYVELEWIRATGSVQSYDWGGGLISYYDLEGSNSDVRVTETYVDVDVEVETSIAGGFSSGTYLYSGATLTLTKVVVLSDVSGADTEIGGFIGTHYGDGVDTSLLIDEAVTFGNVSGGSLVGGFVGAVEPGSDGLVRIENSAALGHVEATADPSYVGGFMGKGYARISDSYASASVTGGDYVSGFIGQIDSAVVTSDVQRTFASGPIVATGTHVGGFTSLVGEGNAFSDNYFNSATVANAAPAESDATYARALSPSQALAASSYANWDITSQYSLGDESVWVICAALNPNGPSLRWIVDYLEVESCALGATIALPYAGPVLNAILDPDTKAVLDSARAGQRVIVSGSQLDKVESLSVAGVDLEILDSSSTEILTRLPDNLGRGTYDLEVASGSGSLSAQGFVRISDSVIFAGLGFAAWTSLKGDYVKVYAKNLIEAGKVQFFVSGREVAWVRAVDEANPKLRETNGFFYLVRSVDLLAGKNVFEIYLDGERVWRAAYTK